MLYILGIELVQFSGQTGENPLSYLFMYIEEFLSDEIQEFKKFNSSPSLDEFLPDKEIQEFNRKELAQR